MKRVALVVEGQGDVAAAPALIARSAHAFGDHVTVCEPAIRAGEARKLRRKGELERFLRLASTREDAEEIVVLLDLDDDCPKEFHEEFAARAKQIADECGKPVHICFCVKEYECWFLDRIADLKAAFPEYGWNPDAEFPNPEAIRGAKEALGRSCNRGYKQTRDQLNFTKKLDIKALAVNNRSFRKLLKSITSKTYAEIVALSAAV